jgi:hypothetical protein
MSIDHDVHASLTAHEVHGARHDVHKPATKHDVHAATRDVVHQDHAHLRVTVPGAVVTVELPPPDRFAFYGGLAVAAAIGLISWEVCAVTALGHALATEHHHHTLEALGEAIEAV